MLKPKPKILTPAEIHAQALRSALDTYFLRRMESPQACVAGVIDDYLNVERRLMARNLRNQRNHLKGD